MEKALKTAFAITNRAPTTNGWKHISQLTPWDELFKWDGTPVKIRRIRQLTTLAMRIRLADGREYVCSEYAELPGKWPVYKAMKHLRVVHSNMLPKNFHLPSPAPVAYKTNPVPIQPYLMGLLCSEKTDIYRDRFEIPDTRNYVQQQLSVKYTLKNRLLTIPFNKNPREINALLRTYHNNLELIPKFIPWEYMTNSIEIRRELLAGIMDSVGRPMATHSKITNLCGTLRSDVLTLANSLGMTAIETPAKEIKIFSKNVPSHRTSYQRQIENAHIPPNSDHVLIRHIKCEGFTKSAEIILDADTPGFLLENYIPVLN